MIIPFFAAVSLASADTTRYVVLNHGRDAGAMVVIRKGESTFVSYNYIDRNRGSRVECPLCGRTFSRFMPGREGRPNAVDLLKAGTIQLAIYTTNGGQAFQDRAQMAWLGQRFGQGG